MLRSRAQPEQEDAALMAKETYERDLLIIGAGPAGLFAAYYAGFRGMSVAVMDSLPEPGGQVSALYPEKQILDVAGFPSIKGQDLIDNCVAQAAPFDPLYLLGHRAEDLVHAGEEHVQITSHKQAVIRCRAVIITGGIGTFTPRPLPDSADWEGRGLMYFVPRLEDLKDLDVLIVGGGDSAFDWAQSLEPIAKSITLVHRRDRFRAHEHSVATVMASSVDVLTHWEVASIRGSDRVREVTIFQNQTDEQRTLPVQAVVAALGFKADLGPLKRWGLEQKARKVVVDTTMATSLPRVFAAGDITAYDGKVDLIAVGFGEAAIAVNNAATVVDPSARLFPGHSSDQR
jgi:thioredoxin reductase